MRVGDQPCRDSIHQRVGSRRERLERVLARPEAHERIRGKRSGVPEHRVEQNAVGARFNNQRGISDLVDFHREGRQ